MTTLDSTLAFTAQTASVTHAENVQITGQNIVLSRKMALQEVKLDPNSPIIIWKSTGSQGDRLTDGMNRRHSIDAVPSCRSSVIFS